MNRTKQFIAFLICIVILFTGLLQSYVHRRGWCPEGRLCCKEKSENYRRARSRRNGGRVTSRRVIKRSFIVFSMSLTAIPKTGKYLKKSQDFLF